jgi:hypothetical protein
MSYVTTSELEKYTGTVGIDSALAEIYIASAENIVDDYLGFSPLNTSYTLILSGTGFDRIILPVHPITEVTELLIDGVAYDVDNLILDDKWLKSKDGSSIFTDGINNLKLTCRAGYSTLPDIIKLTVLRIASLLATEGNGNIGITNKSFSDGSRTFMNYTNFNKYLQALDNIRIKRF